MIGQQPTRPINAKYTDFNRGRLSCTNLPMYGSADRCIASWVDRKPIVPIKIEILAYSEMKQTKRADFLLFAILAVYNKEDHLKACSLIGRVCWFKANDTALK